VAVIRPDVIQSKISAAELNDVATGKPPALANASSKVQADVVVSIGVAPQAQNETQLTATARNTRDAKQIATAAATVGSPPQRRQIDFTGRLLGERLIDQLAGAWTELARQPAPATQAANPPEPAVVK
jgi:hypothetical protein